MDRNEHTNEGIGSFPITQRRVFYILLAVVAGYYLWGWHKEHVLQYWPIGIFLLCPLMHLFHGHGGHAGHRHGGTSTDKHEGHKHGSH